MQTLVKKEITPFIDGEMVGCYDESCETCKGPDCFLNKIILDEPKSTNELISDCHRRLNLEDDFKVVSLDTM